MVNTSKVANKIQSRSLAESPQVRRHRGVVQSVAADGTVGITLDGGTTVLTGVRRLMSTSMNVGDTVEILGDDTDLLVIGRISTAASGMAMAVNSFIIEEVSPDLQFYEVDRAGLAGSRFWWHLNDGRFHLLADLNGDGTWDGPYPLIFNANAQDVEVRWPLMWHGAATSPFIKYADTIGIPLGRAAGGGFSHIPYSDGRWFLTSRPDLGSGDWVFRTYDATTGSYSNKFLVQGTDGLTTRPGEGWTSMALVNGWTNYGGSWSSAQYRKYPDGDIQLRGLLNGSGRTADTIFTLPVGYRPAGAKMFVCAGTAAAGSNSYRVDVQADGIVRTVGSQNPAVAPAYLSLSSIRFSTLGTGA